MMTSGDHIHLVNATERRPRELAEALRELGHGDNRFSGTSFARGECGLEAYLVECGDIEAGRNVPEGKVPQSTYWVVEEDRVVGIVRVRHSLNERLLQYGGHIGYWIRPGDRGKGFGKAALRLALEKLRERGIHRALLTVNPSNIRSIRVVLANGGVKDGQGKDYVTGEIVDRFWIGIGS